MGNPTLQLHDQAERTPCATCRYFASWGEHLGSRYANCTCPMRKGSGPFWNPEAGCKWWEREPGTDSDEGRGLCR
jgi:hypothetical protein